MEEDRWPVRNELVTRIWYMAQRHGFTLPYPVHVSLQHQQDAPSRRRRRRARICSAQFPRLPKIPAEDRARTRRLTFGAGERLFDEGDDLDGVYFVVSGAVSLQMVKGDDVERDCARFGLASSAARPGCTAIRRRTCVPSRSRTPRSCVIAPDAVRHLFEASPRLARDTGHALDVHRKALQSARSAARQG